MHPACFQKWKLQHSYIVPYFENKYVLAAGQGAAEMCQMEHLLNVYAGKVAKKNVADFMGYMEVEDHEATRTLTPGLWLVCVYNTASHHLAVVGDALLTGCTAADMAI